MARNSADLWPLLVISSAQRSYENGADKEFESHAYENDTRAYSQAFVGKLKLLAIIWAAWVSLLREALGTFYFTITNRLIAVDV